jgi:hypothetical protein
MSVGQFYEPLSSEPTLRSHVVKFVGGTTAVTKVFGNGITVSYISTGIVDLVWTDTPGTYVGFTWGLEALTASGVKGYTVVAGQATNVFNASTKTLRLNITGASESLVDLAASQWLNCIVLFKESAAI